MAKNFVKRIILICTTFIICGIFVISCDFRVHPQPTDGIHVREDMEDGTHRQLKKKWFESIHDCDSTTNWRLVERQSALEKYNKLASSSAIRRSSGKVEVAGGALIGTWEEKGSDNLAGSMIKTAYNSVNNKLYAISDGGAIWKGGIDGLSWEIENQDLRFDGRFLSVVYPPEAPFRLLASVGGLPFYKDGDNGNWLPSAGFSEMLMPTNKNQFTIGDGKEVFFLSKLDDSDKVGLYYSKDYGQSYERIFQAATTDIRNVALANDIYGRDVYFIEETSVTTSRIYIFNYQDEALTLLSYISNIGFGNNGAANLQVVKKNNQTRLYSYDAFNNLSVSSNNGLSWNRLSKLPATPWDAGLHISKTDPDIMIIGAIEAHRSVDGGFTWEKVNNWSQYYSDKSTKLHADIMHINEIDTKYDGSITLVSNHGGISRSFDQGATFLNIGTIGLNASQYYSVKTYPFDNDYIFAGSQDQGLQRAYDFDEGTESFRQFIAGDYGHLQFTNYGRSLWAIYPGGWIYYYPDPLNENLRMDFELLTSNRSVWMPPIVTSPYNPNAVLIAGGSLLGTNGSHIVDVSVDDLSALFGTQWPFDFSVSGGDVSAMGYNPVYENEFYVLTSNGKFYKSEDSGVHFEEKNQGMTDAHHLYGNAILTSRINPDRILIAGSGYDNPAVFVSEDAGNSFRPMVEGLPPTSVFQMTYDASENFVFAATEAGPYVYVIKEGKWYDLTQGIAPNQRYWSVEFLESKNKVRFGTYGRGIWDLDLEVISDVDDIKDKNTLDLSIHPNPTTDFARISLPASTRQGDLKIIDPSGKVLFSTQTTGGGALELNLSHYANGPYYIIFDDGTQLLSGIIIKS